MSNIRTMAVAALICFGATSAFAASNLLVNGDFEDGIAVDLGKSYYGPQMTYPVGWIDLANGGYRYPWTVYHTGDFVAENENQYVVGAASSGSHFLAVGGSTGSFYQPGGGLYQNVKVTPNSLLSLSFDFDPNVGPPIVDLLDPNSLNSLGAFNKVITKGTNGWSTVSLQAVSIKDSLRVIINGTGTGSTRLRLDNVQLSAVAIPEPATWSTMSLGLMGILTCAKLRRRQTSQAN